MFRDPEYFIVSDDVKTVDKKLALLDKAISNGYYAAGFLSYELGYFFNDVPARGKTDFPFFVFGVFKNKNEISYDELKLMENSETGAEWFNVFGCNYSDNKKTYEGKIAKIKRHLADGDTYQVNYTFKYKFNFKGSSFKLFDALKTAQDVPYAAFIDYDRWSILSMSPELFFEKNAKKLIVRPMKGTIRRGDSAKEDLANASSLAKSEKDKAENIMIVDLLRNDIGKISVTGTVSPENLFSVEAYNTLFQMTSTVRSTVKENIKWEDFFKSVFPSGSVTGAPKKRTMEIIKELENHKRNIYTGSIGYIEPSGNAIFNVAIRTLLIDKKTLTGEMGIGSGIVADSAPDKEYRESLLKARFLENAVKDNIFSLIETILWEKGKYFLLDFHMERLKNSALEFHFVFNKRNIINILKNAAIKFKRDKKYKVKILMDNTGHVTAGVSAIDDIHQCKVKIAISDYRTDKANHFLTHKTTKRHIYDSEHQKYSKKGYFDCIFFNGDNELTEGAITNIVIAKDGRLFTPPVRCGILPGVYRRYIIQTHKPAIKEKVLFMYDLLKADHIYLINSVRKMVEAELGN